MTKKERARLLELEQILRAIQRRLDDDEVGDVANELYAMARPIRVVYGA